MAEPWMQRIRYAYWKGAERLWNAIHRAAYRVARYSDDREVLARFNAREQETEEQRRARHNAAMAWLAEIRQRREEEADG